MPRRPSSAAAVIARFPRVRVLVAGDLMLDYFIWGTVERISPEAPVPVVQVTTESRRLGGAANVIHNLRALGGSVIGCGVVGADPAGRQLVDDLRGLGADVAGVVRNRGAATTRKTRIIAHHQQVVRLDREDSAQGDGRAAARARGFLLAHLGRADVVVISDYGKGLITPPLLAALAAMRARRPFPLVIDPKKVNYPHYRRPSLVTPNREEASQASGIEIRDAASLARAGAALLASWQAEAVLITRGEQGMSLFVPGAPPRHFPIVARQVYDVTGAGDTVVATCALALGARASLETAAVLANHAAGIVVGELGTATVTAAQLKADLRSAGEGRSTGTMRNPGRRVGRNENGSGSILAHALALALMRWIGTVRRWRGWHAPALPSDPYKLIRAGARESAWARASWLYAEGGTCAA